jgi:hypothetical protein
MLNGFAISARLLRPETNALEWLDVSDPPTPQKPCLNDLSRPFHVFNQMVKYKCADVNKKI